MCPRPIGEETNRARRRPTRLERAARARGAVSSRQALRATPSLTLSLTDHLRAAMATMTPRSATRPVQALSRSREGRAVLAPITLPSESISCRRRRQRLAGSCKPAATSSRRLLSSPAATPGGLDTVSHRAAAAAWAGRLSVALLPRGCPRSGRTGQALAFGVHRFAPRCRSRDRVGSAYRPTDASPERLSRQTTQATSPNASISPSRASPATPARVTFRARCCSACPVAISAAVGQATSSTTATAPTAA